MRSIWTNRSNYWRKFLGAITSRKGAIIFASIVVLAVAMMTREEIHPDYAGDYQELVREF